MKPKPPYFVRDQYNALRDRCLVRIVALIVASQIPGAVVWYEPEEEE